MLPSEQSLHRLRNLLEPSPGLQGRIKARLQAKIEASPAFLRAREAATPSAVQHKLIWQRILERIEPRLATSLLERLRDMLSPADWSMTQAFLPALVPVRSRSSLPYRGAKWVAAFVIVLVVLRATPLLFLAAPRSSAESSVLVIPTSGRVSVSMRGLWEPLTHEVRLEQGAQFRTEEGEATFILNDDGNLRMAPHTTVTLHDVTNRPEPAAGGPTITLLRGRIWVQGLVPEHIRGITIATPAGDVIVHEGSVSITATDTVDVRVWDRHVLLAREGERGTTLVSGERTEWKPGASMFVKKIAPRENSEAWPSQNLSRDAVHRREIAQLQRERTVARAGILPTSPLYSVKRAAEAVDVLLTFDAQTKVEKQLQMASNRLDEATALISGGGSGATEALAEYRSALFAVATGSGQNSVTQFLLRQQVAEDVAQVAAVLPDDLLYLVKKTVLEASADLPSSVVDAQNVEGTLFLDTLDSIQQAVAEGDIERAQQVLTEAQPYLIDLSAGDPGLAPEVRKEALSMLSSVVEGLKEVSESAEGADAPFDVFLEQIAGYLPAPAPSALPMTEEELQRAVQAIVHRIFVFEQPRSRRNQLLLELKRLQGTADEGLLLRRLYLAIPRSTGLSDLTRKAITDLSEKMEEASDE